MNGDSVKVGLVQEPPVFLNLGETVVKFKELTKQCATDGAKIIVFPETWLPGYPIWLDDAPTAGFWDFPPANRLYGYLVENSPSLDSAEIEDVCQTAHENDVYIVLGINERKGRTLYNTTLYIKPDGSFDIHRKLTPTYTERLVWGFGDGSTLNVIDTPWGVLGGLICWEHWMPLTRAAMHAKHEVIHTAQYPTVHERHQIASRQYAFEGQCFVLASGSTLSKDDVLAGFDSLGTNDSEVRELFLSMRNEQLQRGGSAVIGPDIYYVTEPLFDSKETVYADLDLRKVREGNLLLDTDGHYSRPDVFELNVDTSENTNVRFTKK